MSVLAVAALGVYDVTAGYVGTRVRIPSSSYINIIVVSPTASNREDITVCNACRCTRGGGLISYVVVAGGGMGMLGFSTTGCAVGVIFISALDTALCVFFVNFKQAGKCRHTGVCVSVSLGT